MVDLLKKVNASLKQHDLLHRGDGVLVCVSGGPDSRVLLDVLVSLQRKYALCLRIAHVNYGLRGEESDKDEIFVRELAREYALPVHVKRMRKKNFPGNLESTLRDIRYEFFEEVRSKYGLQWIAVAHTLDDQVETFFMRLFRGAGLRGLRSMLPKTGAVIRPLLFIERKSILAYCKKKRLVFRVDASNRDTRFLRNKIRMQLIPYLERNYAASVKRIISRVAQAVAEEQAIIESLAEYRENFFPVKKQTITLSAQSIQSLPSHTRRAQLKGMVESQHFRLTSAQYDELLKIVLSQKSKSQSGRVGQLNVLRKGDTISLNLSVKKKSESKS